jgi:hypothetical protein
LLALISYRPSWLRWTVLLLPVLATSFSSRAPRRVPLFVTNTTCTHGPCRPIRILGFPMSQLRVPGGLWNIELGTITAESACFMIPATTKLRVTEQPAGRTETTIWTTRDSMALGWRPPKVEKFTATPSTEYFVPQHARAWRVALPVDTTDAATTLVHPLQGRSSC